MSESFDAVVVGAGIVGASTAFHLAKLGGLRVCVVDKAGPCEGGTAKSCAIVRSHYSVVSNTQITLRSLEMFNRFRDWLEDDEAACGFVRTGYMIVAPEGARAAAMRVALGQQQGVGAHTSEVSREEARERHPLLNLADIAVAAYEPDSGYADPYLATTSFLGAARKKGAVIRTGEAVTRVQVSGGRVVGVETENATISAPVVVLACGPWSRSLAEPLGLDLRLDVSRHVVLTFAAEDPYGSRYPIVKDMTTENKMYFRPASGDVALVGTGDYGTPISHPDDMDENVGDDFALLQGAQLALRVPSFADARLTASWVGAYDITPDWNPVLGLVEAIAGLSLNYGFSGHGFKLAPAVGLLLAQQILGQPLDVDISAYDLGRFDRGELLVGAYGVGSIS
jgi:sarcosine oxidase subunit beta